MCIASGAVFAMSKTPFILTTFSLSCTFGGGLHSAEIRTHIIICMACALAFECYISARAQVPLPQENAHGDRLVVIWAIFRLPGCTWAIIALKLIMCQRKKLFRTLPNNDTLMRAPRHTFCFVLRQLTQTNAKFIFALIQHGQLQSEAASKIKLKHKYTSELSKMSTV